MILFMIQYIFLWVHYTKVNLFIFEVQKIMFGH